MTPTTVPFSDAEGDRLARRNARVLFVTQALAGANASVFFATGGILGTMMHPDKAMATVPISTFVVGIAVATVPASLLMRAIGRRAGFIVGALLGAIAGLLAALAVHRNDFVLFCLAAWLGGCYQSFVAYYRFAAADTASAAFRPKAISWVLAGGVAAAVVGPQLVIHTKELWPPYLFLATYLGQSALALCSGLTLLALRAPPPAREDFGSGRPLVAIVTQPRFVVALLCGMGSYAVMNFLMTAAPIAMVGCDHSIDDATLGIQWHVIAMYAPSFVTGTLMVRHGKVPVVAAGLVLLAASAAVALAGIGLWHFWIALVLLGIGWNFSFVGATALVTDCYHPEERAKVQAFNDLFVFSGVAVGSFTSGAMLAGTGWGAVNAAVLVVIGLLGVLLAAFWRFGRRATP